METELLEIIRQVKNGEEEACYGLFRMFKTRIYHICLGILGDSFLASDATQEAFIKMFRSIKGLRKPEKFYIWFCRLAINTALDKKRKANRECVLPLEEESAHFAEPAPKHFERDELRRQIGKAMRALPGLFSSAIILREIEGLSYRGISKILKCSIGTVRSRIYRARNLLKEKLIELGCKMPTPPEEEKAERNSELSLY